MIREDVSSWMTYVDIAKMRKIGNEKDIYIWGAFEQGNYIKEFLEEHNIMIKGFIDCDIQKRNFIDVEVNEPHKILNSGKVYVIITVNGFQQDIIEILKFYHYDRENDYEYVYSKLSLRSAINFRDNRNNVIEGNVGGVLIDLLGYNNKLIIGRDVTFGSSCKIMMKGNSTLIIGDGCVFEENFTIIVGRNGVLDFGEKCYLGNNGFVSCLGGKIKIGHECTCGFQLYMANEEKSEIVIGKDCMISNYVKIRSSDGHSIFDIEEKKSFAELKEYKIYIGNHVWIGVDSTILYNTVIGNDSVVGASSLVKAKFPDQCLIAGNPAHIVRQNIEWDRNNNLDFKQWEAVKQLQT